MIETAVFDLETTGISAHDDLIVTAFFGLLDREGNIVREQEWIVDPNPTRDPKIEEALAASGAIHGWTRARLDADPRTRHDLAAVVMEIASLIWATCGGTVVPLAGHNLSYDLTMLSAHLERQGIAPFPFGVAGIKCLDSYVLDKHYDKWLKGSGQRKLTPTAARYGVELTEDQAHDASFDAMAAGRICQGILRKNAPYVVDTPLKTLSNLHYKQVEWRAEQQTSLQSYLRTKGGEPTAICETGWPTYNHERTAA